MKRERWQGFLKDYEGATLMECLVDTTIDYLSTRQLAEKHLRIGDWVGAAAIHQVDQHPGALDVA